MHLLHSVTNLSYIFSLKLINKKDMFNSIFIYGRCCCCCHKVLLLLFLLRLSPLHCFEENIKFCIQTYEWKEDEPNQNKFDFHHQYMNASNNSIHYMTHSKCEIKVHTLTIKEKENLFAIICTEGDVEQQSLHKKLYDYFKFRNGYLNGRGTHFDLCGNKNNKLLAWLPYQQLQHYYAVELDPTQNVNYMAKANDKEHNKTEYCHFRHSDLVNNISENLFTCIVIIHEDNFYDLNDDINVLIEIEPLMYEIRNITYTPWINTTASYKSLLGKVLLKNRNYERKNIFGSLHYVFEERVQLNLSYFYGTNTTTNIDKLPLLFEHKNIILNLDENGEGSINVKEKIFFGRKLESRTQIPVNVIGQWYEHCQQFDADIYDYYGFGIRRFKRELHPGEVTFTRIDNAEPVYEIPQIYESHNDKGRGKHLARIKAKDDAIEQNDNNNGNGTLDKSTFHNEDNEELIEDFETNSVISKVASANIDTYYPWFVLSLLLIGAIILFIIITTTHVCNSDTNNSEQKKRYKFSGLETDNYPVN